MYFSSDNCYQYLQNGDFSCVLLTCFVASRHFLNKNPLFCGHWFYCLDMYCSAWTLIIFFNLIVVMSPLSELIQWLQVFNWISSCAPWKRWETSSWMACQSGINEDCCKSYWTGTHFRFHTNENHSMNFARLAHHFCCCIVFMSMLNFSFVTLSSSN